MPNILISDAIVGEKDGFVEFIVRLDAAATTDVSVQFNNFSGSAGYSDFSETDGTLTFAAGETVKTIRIPITDDVARERDESFFVELYNPRGGTIARQIGTATIIDNDAPSGTPVVRIEDPVVDEKNGTVTFAVILDRPSGAAVRMNYATRNGTARSGSDFEAESGALVFKAGETVKLVTVALNDDKRAEASETFDLVLSRVRGAVAYDAVGTATIGASDATPSTRPNLSVADVVLGEKDGYVDFVIRLDAPATGTVRVSYNTYSGSAGYSDFDENDGFLTFAAGETVKTVRVPVVDDAGREARENFFLELYNATGAAIAKNVGTATIVDNDAPSGTPIVSVADLVVDEASGEVVLTVILDRPSAGVVTMDFATRNGTATAGQDYSNLSGSLSFGPGETVRTVRVPLLDEALAEGSESFDLVLSNLSGATTLDPTGTVTIAANDGTPVTRPSISVDDVVVGEADAYVDFVVRLSAPGTDRVTVSYNSFSGLAGYSDFQENDGYLTFAAGETVKTVRIPIVDDSARERIETFFLEVYNASGASIAKNIGTAMIFDNDAPSGVPVVSVRDFVVDEASGEAVFVVALDRPSGTIVSLDFATANGTALAGRDYTAVSGSLNFGVGETVKTIRVAITDDSLAENSETFSLVLSNIANATALVGRGTAIIGENDAAPVTRPNIAISDVTVGEQDGFADFLVRLDAPCTDAVSVQYNSYSGSAGYSDFGENDGYLTFAPGEMVKTVRVPITDDAAREVRESFFVELYNAAGATISRSVGTGAIIDNDQPSGTPVVALRDIVVDETSKEATFVVTLDRPSGSVVTIDYATADGRAKGRQDYAAVEGTLVFAPGETSKSVSVVVVDDTRRENNEDFQLVLSGAEGARLGDDAAVATIARNDGAPETRPTLSISSAQIGERGGYVDLLVSLSGPGVNPVSVSYNSYSNTAGYSDFVENDGLLTFTPGETAKVIRIEINDDTLAEAKETFFVELFNATNAFVDTTPATVTILDNDTANLWTAGSQYLPQMDVCLV